MKEVLIIVASMIIVLDIVAIMLKPVLYVYFSIAAKIRVKNDIKKNADGAIPLCDYYYMARDCGSYAYVNKMLQKYNVVKACNNA